MFRIYIYSIVLFISIVFSPSLGQLSAQEEEGEFKIARSQQSEKSIINSGDYIDRFEEIQAKKHQDIISDSVNIQGHEQKNLYSNPGISIYFELLGKSFYSFNIDNRINRSKAISFGFSVINTWEIMPSFMFYKFSGAKYRSERGIGLTSTIEKNHGVIWICINGVVGYRYQQKSGLLFRIGFTPVLGYDFTEEELVIIPSFGVSLGYSF